MQHPIATIDFNALISIHQNQPVTTSIQVAQAFNKQHKNVIAKIEELKAQVLDSFYELNFKPLEIDQKSNLGKGKYKTRAYELTKDGFMLLVMGFTGKAAMAIKVAYINAFNQMFDTLSGSLPPPEAAALTPEQRGYLYQSIMDMCRDKPPFHYRALFSALKKEFQVASYKDIKAADYPTACRFLGIAVKSFEGEVIDPPKAPALSNADLTNLKALCVHMRWVSAWFRHYYPAIKLLNNRMAGNIHDHFNDGSFCAASLAKRHGINLPAHEQLKYFPWDGDYHQQHSYLQATR